MILKYDTIRDRINPIFCFKVFITLTIFEILRKRYSVLKLCAFTHSQYDLKVLICSIPWTQCNRIESNCHSRQLFDINKVVWPEILFTHCGKYLHNKIHCSVTFELLKTRGFIWLIYFSQKNVMYFLPALQNHEDVIWNTSFWLCVIKKYAWKPPNQIWCLNNFSFLKFLRSRVNCRCWIDDNNNI